ncbi:TIM-barrel domain-containing protein [Aquimarina gracilis]|uniref:TIM-barrel domain-containing protein n=1 Tax=Aquimarina gracilis TaxID=874422 RepID=A0ABU5ZXY2_9FLAO|nr:TIM-barrel domain-containing protein [Aquimarina gracilis]MEB3346712.1 TIM-barrel domain-containing protein [Aquimarina gracilis]
MLNKIILSTILVFNLCYGFSQENNPVANPEAITTAGNARFTVLTPHLIRMEWSENANFEDKASFVVINRNLEVPSFDKNETESTLTITTKALTLTYKKGTEAFSKDNLTISYILNDESKTWNPEVIDNQNLKGTTRTLDGANGGKWWNGKDIELEDGIISRNGFALLDDSNSFLFDESDWNWVQKRKEDKHQDWYFFGHGHNYKQALKDYIAIAGKIPMLPKYALGYWWSRYWVYSDQELKDLVSDFRTYDIPIDVLIIDMDWHETFGGLKNTKNPKMDETGNWLGWTGYSWNRSLFPNPEKFLDWTNENNLKTALNLHPASGIAPVEDAYQDFAKAYNFDTESKKYIHYQMADKKWAETYFNTLLRPFEKNGIDFWWLDWQQYPESKIVPGLSNTWWLNYTFFTDMEQQSNNRPMIFHRWGGMGNHRYPIGFSGDDKISWGSLKYQTYFTATAANVGYGWWSHDIGGHASSELDRNAELYVRWLQFGVFSPILRTHSAKISSIERRFWKYPDHFKIMKELVQLRYQLAPYIYTASRMAYDTGLSIIRPVYYNYPEKEEAYTYKYQYLFGDDMIISPVSDSVSSINSLAKKDIWLPKGTWYEWHSGSLIEGDKVLSRNFAVDEIPIYVKAGSIIPMYPKIAHLQQQVSDWILNVVPGDQGQAIVYEDDGSTNEYTKDKYATTKVSQKTSKNSTEIIISKRKGTYSDMYDKRTYTLKLLRSFPPKSVHVDGVLYPYSKEAKENYWSYDGQKLTTMIKVPLSSTNEEVKINIIYDENKHEKDMLLNEKQLLFRRVSKMVGDMKIEVARKNWWSSLPNPVLAAEQTPTRIQYNPNNIVSFLEDFERNFEEMKKLILEHPDARKEVAKKMVGYLEY